MIRELLLLAADALFGERCRLGCGQRVYPKDIASHEDFDHAGDPRIPADRAR